jgi:hypothetical protein
MELMFTAVVNDSNARKTTSHGTKNTITLISHAHPIAAAKSPQNYPRLEDT